MRAAERIGHVWTLRPHCCCGEHYCIQKLSIDYGSSVVLIDWKFPRSLHHDLSMNYLSIDSLTSSLNFRSIFDCNTHCVSIDYHTFTVTYHYYRNLELSITVPLPITVIWRSCGRTAVCTRSEWSGRCSCWTTSRGSWREESRGTVELSIDSANLNFDRKKSRSSKEKSRGTVELAIDPANFINFDRKSLENRGHS